MHDDPFLLRIRDATRVILLVSPFPAKATKRIRPVEALRLSGVVEQLALNRHWLGWDRWLKQLVFCAGVNRPEFPQHLIGERVSLDLIISPWNLSGLAEPMKSFVGEDPDNAFVQVPHRGFGINPLPLSPG